MKRTKQFLSLFLALAILFTMLPTAGFAVETEPTEDTTIEDYTDVLNEETVSEAQIGTAEEEVIIDEQPPEQTDAPEEEIISDEQTPEQTEETPAPEEVTVQTAEEETVVSEQAMGAMIESGCSTTGGLMKAPVSSVNYNGNVYSLYDSNLTWDAAKQFCEDQGGHLVTIASPEEQRMLQNLIDNGRMHQYWIGMLRSSGNVAWVTGESVTYSNWDYGEPNYCSRRDGEYENYIQIYNVKNPVNRTC